MASNNNHDDDTMSKLSLLDLGFFIAETEASPKHVGGLLIFKRPPKSPAAFVRNIYREYLTATDVKPPFNRIIHFSIRALPHWQATDAVDLNQHVFYHAIPKGNNDRKSLYDFVSRLHTPMLDRSRPLWEVHVIDGLPEGLFAIYHKMHHAYADGVTMSRWTAEGFTASPMDMDLTPVWTLKHGGYTTRRAKVNNTLRGLLCINVP